MFARVLPDKAIRKPIIALFALTFVWQFVGSFYAAFELQPPGLYALLEWFAFIFVVCWLFQAEMERRKLNFPLDTGMFPNVGRILILPIYFIANRGLRGLFGIFAFLATIIAGWLSAVLVIYLVWY